MRYSNAKSFTADQAWGIDLLAAFDDVDIKFNGPASPIVVAKRRDKAQ